MKPVEPYTMARLSQIFHCFFPSGLRKTLWAQIQPHAYPYRCHPAALPWVLVHSFVSAMPNLQRIAESYSHTLGTIAKSTLADLLNNKRVMKLMEALWRAVEPVDDTRRGRLLAVDTMPITMPATRRTNAPKLNNNTRGIGALWSVALDAPPGQFPVRVIHIPLKPWNDSKLLQEHDLTPKGPTYLLDRGFYSFKLIDRLLDQKVRFIMRARKHQMCYSVQRHLCAPRELPSGIQIELDAVVRLGKARSGPHPVVRLVRAYLPPNDSGKREDLFLVTPLTKPAATTILADYRRRDETEKFHKSLKSSIGLAHLYSFQVNGLLTLLYASLILAGCIFIMAKQADQDLPARVMTLASLIIFVLNAMRKAKGIAPPCRRNIATKHRWKKRKPKKRTAPRRKAH